MCSSGVLPLGHFFWSLTFTVVDEDIYGCSIWVVYLKSLIHSILMCRSDHVAKSLLHKDFKFTQKIHAVMIETSYMHKKYNAVMAMHVYYIFPEWRSTATIH